MLELVRLALRRATTAYDSEIQLLIDDCMAELEGLGVLRDRTAPLDPQIQTAIICYCKWKFGDNPDADRWEKIYRDKVEKLQSMTGYGLQEGDAWTGPM